MSFSITLDVFAILRCAVLDIRTVGPSLVAHILIFIGFDIIDGTYRRAYASVIQYLSFLTQPEHSTACND